MQFNWIDWSIILVVVYCVYTGWEDGFARLVRDLAAFVGSLWLSIRYHGVVGRFVEEKFGIASVWTEVLGYLVVGILAEVVISELVELLVRKLPDRWIRSKTNQILGAVLSAAKGFVVMAFVLLLVNALPLRGSIKNDIQESVVGGKLISSAAKYFGGVEDTLQRFLTIKPESNERIPLSGLPTTCTYKVNEGAELAMLVLVNKERQKAGADVLISDQKIVVVARKHSQDMFDHKYFAHQNLEGHDAVWRMEQGGVKFDLAGENLAFAPDVETAHRGLMESQGHRENILEGRFGRVGIGVIDGGKCGMMFTQNFAD